MLIYNSLGCGHNIKNNKFITVIFIYYFKYKYLYTYIYIKKHGYAEVEYQSSSQFSK